MALEYCIDKNQGRGIMTCKHPPKSLFSWWAKNEQLEDELIIACLNCHEVLKGGVDDSDIRPC